MENKTTYNAETKVWSGCQVPRNINAESSLGKAILEALLKNPQTVGQICYHNGKTYTNEQLAALSISVAHHFTKLGLAQCDVIGICASYTDYINPLFFGAMLKGLIVNSIDVRYEENDIKHVFGITKPKLMFCDAGNYEKVKAALQEIGLNIKIYTMIEDEEGKQAGINEFLSNTGNLNYDFEPLKMGPDQTATILCSSGTTGPLKGLTISNADLLDHGIFDIPPGATVLSFNSPSWISGVWLLLTCTFLNSTRIISRYGFAIEDLFDIVAKYRVTAMMTPPTQMAMLLASPKIKTADLSSIEKYLCGGSSVSYAVAQQLQKYMPKARFENIYGSSEARTDISGGELSEKSGCIGQLSENIQLKIVDENGQRLGPNSIGEFYFKTPHKWLGYFANEKATASNIDAKGWIASGDLGYIDEHGTLYLVDRKKDILAYNSLNYYPTEIEEVIRELVDVENVAVFGIHDLAYADLPTAAVVKRIGSEITEQDVYEHVAKRLVDYKHLRGGVYFLDKLPLTVTGKVVRNELRKICEKLRNEKLSRK